MNELTKGHPTDAGIDIALEKTYTFLRTRA